jgi:hypothetical protein
MASGNFQSGIMVSELIKNTVTKYLSFSAIAYPNEYDGSGIGLAIAENS